MKKYAVIVAGGNGERMGTTVPKQFLLLQQKPLLWYSVDTFLNCFPDIQIILVLPKEYTATGASVINDLTPQNPVIIAEGGPTRFHSVQNGLKQVSEPSVVFVHDAVRCLVTPNLLQRCYEQALQTGSAIPVVVPTDSIRIIDGPTHKATDRNALRIVQTPQAFLSTWLLPAFDTDYQNIFTDEATVVEASGKTVSLVEGEYDNIKITRPLDLVIAEKILAGRSAF